MKYGKDLISRCASTTRTPAMTAVIFANLRGTVRIKSVWAIAKIASTKNGRVSATRRFAPSCDRARSTKTRCPSRISTKTCSNSSRVTANPKPKNSVLVDVHIGHKEIMPPRTGAELKLSASATGAHWLLKWASPPGSGYAAIQQQSESWMCVDSSTLCDQSGRITQEEVGTAIHQ
jgi:hypothetical protein